MAAVCPGEEKDRGQPSPTVPKSPTSLRKGQARRSGSRQNSGTSLAKLAAPGVRREGGDRVGWGGRDTGSNFAAPPPSSELRQFRILPRPPISQGSLAPEKPIPSGPPPLRYPQGPAIPVPHTPRGATASPARPPVHRRGHSPGAAGPRKKGRGRRPSEARRAGPGRGGVGGRTGRSRRPLRPALGRRVCAGPWA